MSLRSPLATTPTWPTNSSMMLVTRWDLMESAPCLMVPIRWTTSSTRGAVRRRRRPPSNCLQGWLEEIGISSSAESVSETRLYAIAGEGTFDMYEWGWVTEPDPDYQASTFTCGQFSYETKGGQIYGGLNDSFYCDPEYDKLYEQQAVETDPEARTEIVKQMQQMVYEANAYIIPYYYDYLQAWRTDRFTGFEHQPEPDGAVLFQYGTFSYLNVEPVTDASGGGGGQQLQHGVDCWWGCGGGRAGWCRGVLD